MQTIDVASDEEGPITQLQRDSRLVTRVVKAPSGELPSVTPAVFALGRDFAGRRSHLSVPSSVLRAPTTWS